MNLKKIAVLFLLVFCCITVIPVLILILDTIDNYQESTLANLIKELE